jgi:hypothetical protein
MLDSNQPSVPRRDPWNKGRLIGQKRPLKPKDVWSIRVRLQVERRARNLVHWFRRMVQGSVGALRE